MAFDVDFRAAALGFTFYFFRFYGAYKLAKHRAYLRHLLADSRFVEKQNGTKKKNVRNRELRSYDEH